MKKAAELLGMDEDEWDDSDDEGKARYEDVDWKHLLPDVKAAATELGYTQEMWDSESSGKKKLAIEDKDWDELSQKERDLLKILGYNEDLVRINMNAFMLCCHVWSVWCDLEPAVFVQRNTYVLIPSHLLRHHLH